MSRLLMVLLASAAVYAQAPAKITYVDGQLTINATNMTLADVLSKVAALTGMKMDLPPGVGVEPMPLVALGPGPARQVLASLLSDSNFNYLIQAADTDPEKIQSLMLLPQDKGQKGEPPGAPGHSPYVRAARAEAPAPDPEPVAQVEPVVAQQSEAPPTPPASHAPTLEPGQLNIPKVSPVPVPTDLSPQSISQQLQQMYQQRAQMVQQERAGIQPGK